MDREIGKVYETTDYSIFKRLEGNREVTSQRSQKIKKNIVENGYVLNPIVVNEKHEIIDGQGRVDALKELNLPVHYVIAQGAGVKECAVLNAANTPWKLTDYIDSYAELKNENYVRLKMLFDEYKEFTTNTKCSIITGFSGKNAVDALKNGNTVFTEKMYEMAKNDFELAKEFLPDLNRTKGILEHYIFSLVFVCKIGASKARLLNILSQTTLPPAPTKKQALDSLTEAYNKKLSQEKRMYFYPLYEESLIKKYGWYGSRLNGAGWRLRHNRKAVTDGNQ